MAMHKHVYEKATGRFIQGGYFDPPCDPETQGVIELPDAAPFPDYARQRWDEAAGALRDATPVERDAAATAEQDAEIDAVRAVKACARVAWEQLSAAQKTAFPWAQYWATVKTRYRQAQTL